MSEASEDTTTETTPAPTIKGASFWVRDPCALFTDWRLFPTESMTRDEKLNALTRLALIVGLVMFVMDFEYWFTFIVLALLIIVLSWIVGKPKKMAKSDGSSSSEAEKEGFTVTPTYLSTDMQQTSVAPLFAEEISLYPPVYDIYDSIPAPVTFEEPLSPQAYPFGQVLSELNLLPSDEFYVRQMGGSVREAREFANDNWTRQSLAFRDNLQRIYKDKLARRFRSSCNDTFSPFNSY